MLLKTPKFWNKRNLASLSLLPLSFIYFIAMLLDRSSKVTQRISKPVICIGNFTAGGSGKTPTAIAIGKMLKDIFKDEEDFEFAYLSSGYSGKGFNFVALREGDYGADEVGDEPLLLNEIAPTFVSKKRLFGAKYIDKIGEIKAIILDDGMQNKSLHKDLVIAVIDGKVAFGNEFLFPAGPLREPLKIGLKEVDFVVVIGEMNNNLLKKISGKKIVNAMVKPVNLNTFLNEKLIAFCGLAYPDKFFSFIEKNNLNIIQKESFADHYAYQTQDLIKLCQLAKSKEAKLITTKKDWIKFPKLYQEKIDYLDIELEFSDQEFIKNELKKIVRF